MEIFDQNLINSSFFRTLSSQLTAFTKSELMFNIIYIQSELERMIIIMH